jgi:hypothetical protein
MNPASSGPSSLPFPNFTKRAMSMSGRSSCPDCGTILRIRDRTFVGRQVNCPECKTALRIESAKNDGDFLMRRLTRDEITQIRHRTDSASRIVGDKIRIPAAEPRPFFRQLVASPLTAAWLLAFAIVSLIAVLALSPKLRFTSGRPASIRSAPETPVEKPPETDAGPGRPDETPRPDEALAATPRGDQASASAMEPANLDAPLPLPPGPPAGIANIPLPEPVVPAPPPPPKVDVDAALSQKLVSFKQAKPVSRRELLELLQELLGIPVRYESTDLGISELDKKVTLELENPTVGQILKRVTEAAEWTIEVEATGVRIRRSPPAPAP